MNIRKRTSLPCNTCPSAENFYEILLESDMLLPSAGKLLKFIVQILDAGGRNGPFLGLYPELVHSLDNHTGDPGPPLGRPW